ncbi:MAG: prolyl oligopeptidase family serine peptidase [Planctomycetes bacterium]|nr:prolyl oligopeptidase family serine peptidase [Planctomycetota bacterium]
MNASTLPCWLLAVAGTVALLAGCSTAAPLLWHEAESYTAAPPSALDKTVDDRVPASGGQVLYSVMGKEGNTITYDLDLPADIPDAVIHVRYARLHWRETMTPGIMAVEVAGAGEPRKAELAFDNTGGWGTRQQHFGLASAALGDLKAGPVRLTLTVVKDADQNTDGFFLAPAGVAIDAKELSRLARVQITSDGYLGLLANSMVTRQTGGARLCVAARSFTGTPGEVEAAVITKSGGRRMELRQVQSSAAGTDGTVVVEFAWPEVPDGDCTLEIACDAPKTAVTADLVLAGQLIAAMEEDLGAIEQYVSGLAASDNPYRGVCLADLEHAVEYLKAGQKSLTESAPARTAWQEGLAEHEGRILDGRMAVTSIRHALAQTQETIRRLKAGEHPYEGRTGEMRRAYRSASDNALIPYRVLIPEAYWTTDKVPFVYMLHGGGGDENYWPEMADGLLLEMLNRAGYVAVMPKWHSRNRPSDVDVPQLLELTMKEYPRIDADRVYCTGISMGGFGTYTLTTARPGTFAAACCVSGTGDADRADRLKNVPLLILQGGSDGVVPPAGAERVAARMKELGQTVEIHVFPTHGHAYYPEQYMKLTLDFFGRHRRTAGQ